MYITYLYYIGTSLLSKLSTFTLLEELYASNNAIAGQIEGLLVPFATNMRVLQLSASGITGEFSK